MRLEVQLRSTKQLLWFGSLSGLLETPLQWPDWGEFPPHSHPTPAPTPIIQSVSLSLSLPCSLSLAGRVYSLLYSKKSSLSNFSNSISTLYFLEVDDELKMAVSSHTLYKSRIDDLASHSGMRGCFPLTVLLQLVELKKESRFMILLQKLSHMPPLPQCLPWAQRPPYLLLNQYN